MRRLGSLALLLTLALTLSACLSLPTRFKVGAALKDLNTQVVETDKLYTALNTQSAVTPEEFSAWKRFITRYKIAEAQAYAMWNAGETGTAAEIVDALRVQLRDFLLAVSRRRVPVRHDDPMMFWKES